RGECLDQIYLLIVEGPDLLPIDSDGANQVVLLEHRHDQKRSSPGNLGNRLIGIFRSDVGDVCDLPGVSDTVEDTGRATRRNRIALAISGPRLRCIVQRDVPEYIAFVEQQVAEAGLADANGVLKHSLEHWLQFAGRAADDLEHVGGGGLLLQRVPQLVEQARVLDRNDGLGSEVRDQLDVLVGEGAYFLAIDGDGADQLALLQHRHQQQRPGAAEVGQLHERCKPFAVSRFRRDVGDLEHLSRSREAAKRDMRGGANDRLALITFGQGGRYAVPRDRPKPITLG